MPVHECEEDGKPGYQWGSGKCYTYDPNDEKSREAARKKAGEQGAAAHAHGYGKSDAGMLISKTFETKHTAETPTDADLETIKKYALRSLSAEDVWLGKMALANDQVDRSNERFPVSYLERFAVTLPGKPVLTGHDQSKTPVGKFYSADVVPRADGTGNDLIARYYLRAGNPLASDIELGIASGVSIGARADKRFCGICAKDYDSPGKDRCSHSVGHTYDGKTCTLEWGGDAAKVEALEGSFVASPCQFGAQALARNYDGSVLTKGLSIGAVNLSTPRGDAMTLEEAEAKITTLESEITALKKAHEDDPLVKAGQEYMESLKTEAVTKSGVLGEAEKAQTVALLGSVETPNLTLIKAIHGSVMARFDEKHPPTPLGKPRDEDPKDKPARFDPVAANPWRRSA